MTFCVFFLVDLCFFSGRSVCFSGRSSSFGRNRSRASDENRIKMDDDQRETAASLFSRHHDDSGNRSDTMKCIDFCGAYLSTDVQQMLSF